MTLRPSALATPCRSLPVGGGGAVREEDAEARFRRLYGAHYEALLAYAMRRVDAADAHDVVAEAFLVLWRRLDRAPADDAEVPLWLYGVARNIVRNTRRGRVRRERLAARLGRLTGGTPDTADTVAARGETEAVLAALRRLKEHDREILLLAAWERLSTAQIASATGCSENAAAIRLHRARKRLAEVLEKERRPGGDRPVGGLRRG